MPENQTRGFHENRTSGHAASANLWPLIRQRVLWMAGPDGVPDPLEGSFTLQALRGLFERFTVFVEAMEAGEDLTLLRENGTYSVV